MEIMKVKPWGKDQGDHVLLNVSDFDPKRHEPYDDAEAAKVGISPKEPEDGKATAAQLREQLTAKGIAFKSNASKGELQALLDAA